MNILITVISVLSILVFAYCITHKIKIKFRTFLKKGFRPVRGNFGVYCYCGKQGKGKTYSLVEYLQDNKDNLLIFSNIDGIKHIDYTFYTGFKELIQIKHYIDRPDFSTKKQIVIVYDEIFTELQKGDKLSKEVLDFLCQMRKRKIIFLTTAQEWAEIPLSFRRFCRYQIDCCMIPILTSGILVKRFYDAENMKWSNDEQEHVAPLLETTITHTRKYIANSYDTFLRISSVNPDTKQ